MNLRNNPSHAAPQPPLTVLYCKVGMLGLRRAVAGRVAQLRG